MVAVSVILVVAVLTTRVEMATSLGTATCGGSVTNGTRPGQDYASIKMNKTTGLSAVDCEKICCADDQCATWVFVPSGLYPNRPPGTFCWLKAAAIPLKGVTCDNGKPGCVSGVVNRSPFSPDADWKPSYSISSATPTGVSSCAVGVGTDSNVYVGQRGANIASILVLDGKTGKAMRGFGAGDIKNVHGMHMQSVGSNSFLWVTDSGGSAVLKYDPVSGKLLNKIGTKGTSIKPLQFGSVADVAFDAEGAVYISDGDGGINSRVMKLDSAMELVWAIGNNGTVANNFTFASPHSLAYDSENHRIIVADRNNNQVRFLDATSGKYLGKWPSSVFAYQNCDKPAVWSVRTDVNTHQVFVATSNFGSGAGVNCSGGATSNKQARIFVLKNPSSSLEANVLTTINVAHGFPHEICVDSRDMTAVYSAAVDAPDLPNGTGLGAITKYSSTSVLAALP